MQITNCQIIEFPDDNRHFIVYGGQSTFLAGRHDGKDLMLFDDTGKTLHFFNLDSEIVAIGFLHQKEQIFFSNGDSLQIVNYELELIHSISGNFQEVYVNNRWLWMVRYVNRDKVLIQVYDTNNFQEIAHIELRDTYGESSFLFFEGADLDSLILWMAAGQDGQSNFFLKVVNQTIEVKEVQIGGRQYGDLPTLFNYEKNHFMESDYHSIWIFSYPEKKLKLKFDYPDIGLRFE